MDLSLLFCACDAFFGSDETKAKLYIKLSSLSNKFWGAWKPQQNNGSCCASFVLSEWIAPCVWTYDFARSDVLPYQTWWASPANHKVCWEPSDPTHTKTGYSVLRPFERKTIGPLTPGHQGSYLGAILQHEYFQTSQQMSVHSTQVWLPFSFLQVQFSVSGAGFLAWVWFCVKIRPVSMNCLCTMHTLLSNSKITQELILHNNEA